MALQLPGYQLSIGSASPPKHFTEYDNAGFYKMAESIANAGNNLGNALGGYMQRQREQEGLASMASAMNSGDIGAAAMAAAQSGDREMATKLAMYGLQQKQEANALSQVNSILGGGEGSSNGGGASPASYPQDGAANTKPVPKVVVDTAEKYGINPNDFARMAWIESKFNPNAAANGSSAGGLFQFIDSTAANYGLKNKFDAAANADAAARLWMDNKAGLTKALGREPTGGELYLAHQQGLGGAAKLLANPNAPATAIVGHDAVRLNGGSSDMTAGQFANLWINKFNKVQPGIGKQQGPDATQTATAQSSNEPYQVAGNNWVAPPGGQAQPQQGPNTDAIIAKMQNMGKVLMLPNVPDGVKAGIKAQMDILNSQLNQANEQYKYSRDTARDDYKFNREMEAKDPSNVMHKETMARLAVGQGMGLTGPALQEYVLNGKAPTQASQAPTEGQGNAASFAERAMVANNIASDPAIMKFGLGGTGRTNAALGSIPLGLGQDFQDPGYQQYDAAKTNFITAILRKESGAAIGKEEYAREEAKYFPKFGEKNPEIIQQKADARRLAIDTLAKQGSAQFQQEFSKKQQSSNASPMEGRTATNPQTGQRIILRNGRWEPL